MVFCEELALARIVDWPDGRGRKRRLQQVVVVRLDALATLTTAGVNTNGIHPDDFFALLLDPALRLVHRDDVEVVAGGTGGVRLGSINWSQWGIALQGADVKQCNFDQIVFDKVGARRQHPRLPAPASKARTPPPAPHPAALQSPPLPQPLPKKKTWFGNRGAPAAAAGQVGGEEDAGHVG